MSQNAYVFESRIEGYYQFESVGSKGTIRKAVEIFEIPYHPGLFNVGFGDVQEGGCLDDKAETNNGDLVRVFGTVIAIMKDFLNDHAGATLFFCGSTKQRTAVYQMILKRYYREFDESFDITAIRDGGIAYFEGPFDPGAEVAYLAFFIKKKW